MGRMPAATEADPTVRMSVERLVPRRAEAEPSDPAALLGPTHPLARALEDRSREIERVMVSAAVLAGAGGATLTASAAPSLSIAAAIALSAFGVRLAFICDRVRCEALRAVIDGRDGVPLACLRAERRRLEDPRHQEHLAAWAEALAHVHAEAPAPSIWSVRVLRAAEPELREVARLLRAGHTGTRGVAMLDQLLRSGATPLYGNDERALVEQLRRIRYHLCARA